MKTKILTLSIIFSLITFNAFAIDKANEDEQEKTMLIKKTKETKEYIFSDQRSGEPIQKKVFTLGADGERVESLIYLWDQNKGWVASLKLEYKYNAKVELEKIVSMKWDDHTANWVDRKEQIIRKS